MNENEQMNEISAETAEPAEPAEHVQEINENAGRETEEPLKNDGEDVLSHPMFAHFARGRRGNIEDICRDFREMLSAMPKSGVSDLTAKMTPSVSANAAPDLALTERQRMIARAAGMSYREYYALVSDVPAKRK